MGSRDHAVECDICGLLRGGLNNIPCNCDVGATGEIIADAIRVRARFDRGRVLFLAHPVAALHNGPTVLGNIVNAKAWLRWLMLSEPEVAFIAPWLTAIDAGADDSDPAQRERGIRDNEAVLARCNGIVLVGGRISSGMQRELALATKLDQDVDDLTFIGYRPPAAPIVGALSMAHEAVLQAAHWEARHG